MIRPVMRDTFFLKQPSEPVTIADSAILQDLMDTLRANQDRCVGMAANMIGVHKRIIAFCIGPMIVGMYNPVITKKSGPYETRYYVEEGFPFLYMSGGK